MMSAIVTTVFLFGFNISVAQQSSDKLTLSECIAIAHKRSTAAKIAKESFKKQLMDYNAFKESFYPQFSFTGSVPGLSRAIGPVIQPDGSQLFRASSLMSSSGNITISQKIPLTGAEIFMSSGINRIEGIGDSKYKTWSSSPFSVVLNQPLFQYNDLKWNQKIEDTQAKYFDRQYVESMENLSVNITAKFFDLFIAQMNVKNAELNKAINDTLYQLSQGRYKVGTIAENDLLQSELELANAKNELEQSKLDYGQALDELRIALGFDENRKITIVPPTELPDFNIDQNKAIEHALNNSSVILNLQVNKEQAEMNLDRTESNNSFNATLSASYGLNKTTGEIDYLYKQLLTQESFNLTFSVPIFQWGKGASQVESALASKYSAEHSLELNKKEFKVQVKYEVLRFKRLQEQVEIAARSDTIASRRFEVAKNRFLIGKIGMNDLFLSQNDKDNASKNYYQTLKNYWSAYYTIRKMTLFDFVNKKPIEYQADE